MKRIAVYGSLRKGDYNYERCIPGAEVIEQVEIEGWTMYDLGYGYPAIVKGDGMVLFDIMDVTDEQYERVESMELGAGYLAETVKLRGASEAVLFYMRQAPEHGAGVIESGDWIKHKEERSKGDAFSSIRYA